MDEQMGSVILGVLLTAILGWIGKSAAAMARDVKSLNIKMALIADKVTSHEVRIADLEGKRRKR